MRRPALYSNSTPRAGAAQAALAEAPAAPAAVAKPPGRLRRMLPSANDPRVLWLAIGLLAISLAVVVSLLLRPGDRKLTQEDIDAAVLKTLETNTLPSAAAKAAEVIAPSLVRVVSYEIGVNGRDEIERGVGSGVVIVDKGIILTNLHVVQGAELIKVTFADGLESVASIRSVQPENDLAVLQAHKIPDDLTAAAMRSTNDLMPGDQVVAVGFPFGIGPSTSAGVISGLKRSFRSPEGQQEMTNLIQFDAAANPGNSGGPLVTMDGQVVGIVTAILNPSNQRTFIGIGFAVPIESAAGAVGLHPF
jgi:S1-C subfamily serine protease